MIKGLCCDQDHGGTIKIASALHDQEYMIRSIRKGLVYSIPLKDGLVEMCNDG